MQGLRAVAPQPAGWDTASAGVLTAKDLFVTDSTHAVIVISQLSSYDILFAEEVRMVLPAASVESGTVIVSNNTLRIQPTAGIAVLRGSLLQNLDETLLRGWGGEAGGPDPISGGEGGTFQLTIQLSGDSFVPFPLINSTNASAAASAASSGLLEASGGGGLTYSNGNGSNGTADSSVAVDIQLSLRERLIQGIASSSSAPRGWNAEVRAALRPEAVEWVSPFELRVTVEPAPAYAIDSPETVVVDLHPSLLSSQERIVASPALRIAALAGTAALRGPLVRTTERDVQRATRDAAAAAELELEVEVGGGDDWEQSVGTAGELTTALLLAGLRSAQAEATGWNAVVQPALSHAHLSAPRNGSVTVRLPQLCASCAGYEISSPETIQLTIPAEALLSRTPIPLATTLVVNASAGSLQLGGSLAANATEADLRDAMPRELELRLSGDVWQPRLGQRGYGPTDELLAGLVPTDAQPGGWAAVVQPRLSPSSLRRLDDHTVRLTLPQLASYAIDRPETIHVSVAASAVLSGQPTAAALPLLVGALPGVAAVGGSLTARPEEGLLQSAAGSTLRVRLTADTWVDDLHSPAVFAALAAGVAADTDTARGWNRVVRSALNQSHLLRLDDATIEWRLPQFAEYTLRDGVHVAPESLSVSLPASALVSDRPTAVSAPLVLRGTRARLRGALLEAADEATVRAPGGSRLVIELRGDQWVDDLDATPCDLDLCGYPPPPPSPSQPPLPPPALPPSPPANFSVEPNFTNVTHYVAGAAMVTPRACTAGSALLAGIQSLTFHPTGWNRYVQPLLQLQRYDNLTIVVGVPQVLPPRRAASAPHPLRTRFAPASRRVAPTPQPNLRFQPPAPLPTPMCGAGGGLRRRRG